MYYSTLYIYTISITSMQTTPPMQSLLQKLGDHLPGDRILVLLENGFEQWETITYMKGDQLVDMGYDTQECIVVMVAVNANAQQYGQAEVFTHEQQQAVLGYAKEADRCRKEQIEREEKEEKGDRLVSGKSIPSLDIKQYPPRDISEQILLKGIPHKTKPGEKPNLAKVTVLSLQQKQITHITNLDRCPALVNLHLGNNYIYKIEGLEQLNKIKVLKLEHNNIGRIEGLGALVNLEILILTSNYISRLENLQNNRRLQQLYISRQKINTNFSFDQESTMALAYTLQKLECNQNKIRNISGLRHLAVVKQVQLAKNQLEDVGQLSQTITGMQSIKTLSFKDCPLTKSSKYRDYIVILSKSLEELDGKKILAKQRQYLVKLYALKHAKQSKQDQPKKQPKSNKIDLQGVKYQQQFAQHANINRATDLRGNLPYTNTKHVRK